MTVSLIGFTIALAVALTEARPANAQISELKRTDLQRHDLSAPGREVVQNLVEISAGSFAPKHLHPGEEIVYVVKGTLEYQLEGKPPSILKAGDVLFIPSRTVHSVKNLGKESGVELATYVVEKGKPLITFVK